MLLIRSKNSRLLGCMVLAVVLCALYPADVTARPYHFPTHLNIADTTVPNYRDSLHYPIRDRRGDNLTGGNRRTLDLRDPSNIKDSVVYDPKTRRYVVYEKIGTKYYRTTTSYSFEEYWAIRGRQSEVAYFQKRANTRFSLNRTVTPKLSLYDNLFNRLF
ncbi:MAG TPA: hypothetical protein VHL77_11955, partial [Ferruginibacter sp.]|nr:hypothetical protein [Ferruginibacter sp.]